MSPIVSDLLGRSIELPNSFRCQQARAAIRALSHLRIQALIRRKKGESKKRLRIRLVAQWANIQPGSPRSRVRLYLDI